MNFDQEKIEIFILKSLMMSETFTRTFYSKLSSDLFSTNYKDVSVAILSYFRKTNRIPDHNILENLVIPKVCMGDQERIKNANNILNAITLLDFDMSKSFDYITDETKKFIRVRTVMNAFIKCVDMVNNSEKHPEIVATMETAFKLNFDESMGQEYLEDLESRQSRCNESSDVVSTGLLSLDNLIGGGYRKKALFVYAGPANSGKTLVLNDAATSLAFNGKNVLYLTLELSEDYIAQRTDAKFTGITMNSINASPSDAIKKAIAIRDTYKKDNRHIGRLIYKEYAPNAVTTNDIKALLHTLKMKKDFIPDYIIVDYLKLVKPVGKVYGDNMYGKLGTVCEELRGLAMEYNLCVLSASQTGRQSYNAKEIDMEDVSDSIAIAQTADVLVTIIRDENLDREGQAKLYVAKSRYSKRGDSTHVKVDYDLMKLVDLNKGSEVGRPITENKKQEFKKPEEHVKNVVKTDINEELNNIIV